ncbi:large conductance mechanosensitive channel protein [Hyaloraphidium curvatum]|nr:large conductance mechanosensitive channel protein [Hyaloraphidium curvatum]
MSDFAQDFFKFISRGNVIDLAVGIIIGNAFTAIVTSLVDDMISPILGLMGNKDLAAYNAVMRPGLSGNTSYPTPAQAKADQAITLAWGNFINSIINFFLIAIVVFLMIKFIGLFYRKKESIVQVCWWCREPLKGDARRCDNCGSVIPSRAQEKVMEVMEKVGPPVACRCGAS